MPECKEPRDAERGEPRPGYNDETDATAVCNAHVDVSEIDEAKLIRKIDWRLLPWLSLLHLLCFLDRTSIGNAKLYSLVEDLHLDDKEYLLCLTILYVSYALFAVPSNMFLKRLCPSVWVSTLVLLWGVVMTVQGLVRNYGQLLGMRWLLGAFEAELFPGISYYLSCWYTPSESGVRTAFLALAVSISGAFGGLLAAAISKMGGVCGKPGWAWIFILEGLATVVAGFLSFWIIQDFPDSARFLTDAEQTIIVRRLQTDDQYSTAGGKLEAKYIQQSLSNWKTYLTMLMYAGCAAPLYSFALFLPTIINQIGYRATHASLLTVPIYVVACILTCTVGFYADRKGQRGLLNIIFLCIAAAGYTILICSRNPTLSYVAVYFAACGIYPVIPNAIAWVSNNVEGSYKRRVSLAMVISFGNLNAAVTSNVYRARDKPWYTFGHGVILIYIVLGITTSVVYYLTLKVENAQRDRGMREEIIDGVNDGGDPEIIERLTKLNGRFATVEDAKREKGDNWSGYRYIL